MPRDEISRDIANSSPVVAQGGFAVGVQVVRIPESPGHGLPAISPRSPSSVVVPVGLPPDTGPSAAEPCRAGAAVVIDQENVLGARLHNASEFGDGAAPCPYPRSVGGA